MSKRYVGLLALSLVGCSGAHQDPQGSSGLGGAPIQGEYLPSDDVPDAALPPPPPANFEFFVAQQDGERSPLDTFDSTNAVYLAAAGAGGVEGDYYFRVTAIVMTPFGNDTYFASDDPSECRRFHVAANGQIDLVYPAMRNGVACQHASSVTASGSLVVQLEPFEDISNIVVVDSDGKRRYNVDVAPFGGNFLGDDSHHLAFYVRDVPPPPPAPVCGDGVVNAGEECDDGNTNYNDGCSGTCTVEHLCCCGNGTVEAGEECDDGNHSDGDSCSSDCRVTAYGGHN